MLNSSKSILAALLCWVLAISLPAQELPPSQAAQPQQVQAPPPLGQTPQQLRTTYLLGANDQISVQAIDLDELNGKVFRIDSEGNIIVPQVGSIPAAGLTLDQLQAELIKRYRVLYHDPQITVDIVQMRVENVYLIGAFRAPGVRPLQGGHTLMEVLAGSGGILPTANKRITVTRSLDQGRIPLPDATEDLQKHSTTVEIVINPADRTTPEQDLVLKANDVLHASVEEMVYVSGEVTKPGLIPLNDRDSISVVQLLAMSGGFTTNAVPQKAKVLRPVLDTPRRAEIPLNLKDIVNGRANDFMLMPNDVLIVPSGGKGKSFFTSRILPTLITSMVSILVGVIIVRKVNGQ